MRDATAKTDLRINNKGITRELITQDEALEAHERVALSQETFEILRVMTGTTQHGKGFEWEMATLGDVCNQPTFAYMGRSYLTPEKIKSLYQLACVRLYDHFDRRTVGRFGTHPCDRTPSEVTALRLLLDLKSIRRQLQPYNQKSGRSYPLKPIFGPYVPDIIILGIRPARSEGKGTRFQGIIIEIDGAAHDSKMRKDAQFDRFAEENGFFVWRVRNEDVKDIHINLFKMLIAKGLKLADTAARNRVHRDMMLRSIACWLTRDEIADHLRDRFGHGANLFAR